VDFYILTSGSPYNLKYRHRHFKVKGESVITIDFNGQKTFLITFKLMLPKEVPNSAEIFKFKRVAKMMHLV
jgi:hypothetical protein